MSESFGSLRPAGTAAHLIALSRHTPLGRGRLRKLLYHQLIALRQDAYDVEVGGARMRLHPKDNTVESKLILRPDAYCAEEIAFIIARLEPGMSFVDIGANIGAFTVPVARTTSAPTLAFEPNPKARARLAFNVAANALNQVRIDPRAVSDTAGTVAFNSVDDDLKVSGFDSVRYAGSRLDVQTVPLLDALNAHGLTGPWGLKIDIEGAEDAALLPFFAAAPLERWPRFAVIEAIDREGLPRVIDNMLARGYRQAFRTRANIGLVRD